MDKREWLFCISQLLGLQTHEVLTQHHIARLYYVPLLRQSWPLLPPGLVRVIVSYTAIEASEADQAGIPDDHTTVVWTVRDLLRRIEITPGLDCKRALVTQLYEYLLDNRRFVWEHKQLQETVIRKTDELTELGHFTREQCDRYTRAFSRDVSLPAVFTLFF